MIKCQDKKKCNWSNYVEEGWGLTIDSFKYGNAGYISSWTLCSSNGLKYTGETTEGLLNTFRLLIRDYDLKVEDSHTKDILVIYTDDINKAYWFLYNHGLYDAFTFYFQIMRNIEIRACWDGDCKKAEQIAEWAALMIKEVFAPDKYFYITSSQISRKRISKSSKKYGETLAKDIYPKSLDSYNLLREAYFGGILYVPYPGLTVEEPVIEIDLKSAYIWCLLVMKHVVSISKKADPANWEYYIESKNKASFGRYKIKYSCYTNKITCYKNENNEHCFKGEDIENIFTFTDTDLALFLKEVNATSVECLTLFEYDLDYLPQGVREELIDEYIKKERLSKEKPRSGSLSVQKVILNSVFGNCCRNWDDDFEGFKSDRDKASLAPQWGVWTTSYCKKLILELGNTLEGWLYSATDSIYCLDTKENREKIEKYNEKTRNMTKDFCDTFSYDYEALKDLGTFCVKTHIVKFKAFGPNAYIYAEQDGEIVIKASGCTKEYRKGLTQEEKEALFEVDQLPTGNRKRGFPNKEKTSCTIDGKTYTSDGSYYYEVYEGDVARVAAIAEIIRKRFET